MKNIKLWLIVLPLISIACTTDNETAVYPNNAITLKTGAGTAENPLNPYDYSGRAFDAVLEAYSSGRPTTIAGIAAGVDATVAALPEAAQYPHGQSLAGSVNQIGALSSDNSILTTVLASSDLSTVAKSSFSSFMSLLATYDAASYETVYNYVLTYEAAVISNASFSSWERQAILTATSVARYSLYRKKRKDKDWESSIWAISAALYGAQENVLFGARMAAATGLCHNYAIEQ